MKRPLIVGLGYQMQTGKDTIASYLILHGSASYPFKRIAFADPLKDAAAAIFGFDRSRLDDADYKAEVDPYWGVTRRTILQKLGTECLRKGYADDVWIRAAKRRVEAALEAGRSVVLPDVRFINEVEAVRSWGGVVWRVKRDAAPVHAHVSELELNGYAFDGVVENNGTMEELYRQVDALLGAFS